MKANFPALHRITCIQRTPPRFPRTAGGHAPARASPLLRRVLGLFSRRWAFFPPSRRVLGLFSRRWAFYPPSRRVLGLFSRRFGRFRQTALRSIITNPVQNYLYGIPVTNLRGASPEIEPSATRKSHDTPSVIFVRLIGAIPPWRCLAEFSVLGAEGPKELVIERKDVYLQSKVLGPGG